MDIPRVDAWLLHCLVTLVNESNVTRAGAALDLSQPATSAILAKLRVLFQDPLLVKSTGRMIPTPRAQELALRAEKVLIEMRSMVDAAELFDASKARGSVTIAAMDLVRALLLPGLLGVLRREAPGLDIIMQDVDRTRIHERFERAEIDLGIGPQVVSTGRLHYRQLWCDTPACLVRQQHPILEEPLSAERLAGLSHLRVVLSRSSFYDDALDTALRDQGLKRRVVLSERSFLMVPRLLASTDLIAITPRTFALDARGGYPLQIIDPPIALPELSMGLYWHERTHREPLFQWLRRRIAEVACDLASMPA